jgi:hypothetical protein
MDAPQVDDGEDDDREFWLLVSMSALKEIWDNPEDEVYAELLKDDSTRSEVRECVARPHFDA